MRLRLLLLTFLTGALQAQVVLGGDARLRLADLLRPHPEGELLLLPDAQGRGLLPAVQAALTEPPADALQLTAQELDPRLPSGRELRDLGGWDPGKPHWALIGPDRRIQAEGDAAPTAAALAQAYAGSSLRTRADRLRAFLREHPDQGEARAQLLLQLRDLAEARTDRALKGQADDAQLPEAEDDRIWGEYAEVYARFFDQGLWKDADPGPSSPVGPAAALDVLAARSPRLRDLAARLLPAAEDALRAKPSDPARWAVWQSLRAAGAGGRAVAVLAGLEPWPGARRWPPEAAVDAFVEDARTRADWRDAEPVLQASFDANEALIRDLEAAARKDAGPGVGPVDLGGAFGFGQWNGDTAALVEAKLRLGKRDEADRIATRVLTRVPRPEFRQAAAQLARDCGDEALAVKWAALGE